MKRFLQRLPLLLAVLLLLTTAVLADMGPKPQLTVVVEHAPSELYYLDLLAEGEYEYDPDFAMDETGLDPELLAAFRAAIPDGWHACIAEGTTGAPIWGELTGDPVATTYHHSFRYYGVPETYRILIVTASGETFLSDVLTRSSPPSRSTGRQKRRSRRCSPKGICCNLPRRSCRRFSSSWSFCCCSGLS